MTNQTLVIKESVLSQEDKENFIHIDYSTLKTWCKSGKIFQKFRNYHDVIFYLDTSPLYRRAVIVGLLGYFLKKKRVTIKYANQIEVKVTLLFLFKRLSIFVRDLLSKPFFLNNLNKKIEHLYQNIPTMQTLPTTGSPYYIRTDFHFMLLAGGSVGHIAGVLNNLENEGNAPPLLFSCTKIPTVKKGIPCHLILPDDKFLDFNNFPNFAFSSTYTKKVGHWMEKHPPRFIYERFSCGSISGVELSQKYHIPLILEYNGSEVWVSKHWGKKFHHENIFLAIEDLNLRGAQLIVVVSAPLKEQLVERGIDPHKILVNPNGVDPQKYTPEIDGSPKRDELKVKDKIVIGFIGTFGKWHGAEVLTECFGKLLDEYREKIHLLMIGDGIMMSEVTQKIHDYQMESYVTLMGMIPQSEAPEYLAACDILASPHVPNSDGSKFFGSPTKLFEYMAMGKGIVASDLDQIGEVLEHKKTAYLVKPGDQEALVQGLKVLIDHPDLRQTLGINAREEVVKNYTWKQHTHKILEKLKELCPSV